MRLVVTNINAGLWAASYLKQTVQTFAPGPDKPFTLGLPTGQTVLDMYAILRCFVQERLMSFQHIFTFNMDEYVGLAQDHPQSYFSYMRRQLWEPVNMPPQNRFIPDGMAASLPDECVRYEQEIARVGGMRLVVGGIGNNGHIAFNEPGTPFNSRTHAVDLAPATLKANARFFGGDESRVPRRAITMGIGTILDAQELLFIATGVQKAAAVEYVCSQPTSVDWPITALTLHPRATLLVDLDACLLLSGEMKNRLDEARQADPHAEQWVLFTGGNTCN